jgi:hypothetical protein
MIPKLIILFQNFKIRFTGFLSQLALEVTSFLSFIHVFALSFFCLLICGFGLILCLSGLLWICGGTVVFLCI